MRPYPHQVAGAEWLAPRSRALLGDEAGCGKTITAIVAADRAKVGSILVMAPTVVIWNWANEIRKWSPHRKIHVVPSSKGLPAHVGETDVVIITHGLLIHELVYTWLQQPWGLGVLDEAHCFRNRKAQRTRAVYGKAGIASFCEKFWPLTGTPMPNNCSELWPMLRSLWPDRCSLTYPQFVDEFCETRETIYGVKIIGNKNLPKLKAMMEGTYLRRLKRDHLDLPAIRFETVTLRPEKMPHELRRLVDELDKDLRKLLAAAKSPEEAFGILSRTEEFARYRRLCGLAKAEPAAELIAMDLDGGIDKIVVAAHHLDVIEYLSAALEPYGVVEITGSITAQDRTDAVAKFQSNKGVRVAICQIQAGGVGITLHAASEMVFVEQEFVPADNSQMADRIHRIGQTEPVRVRFLSLAGTVDEVTAEILATKSRMIAEILEQ